MSLRGSIQNASALPLFVLVAGMACFAFAARLSAQDRPAADLLCEHAPSGFVQPVPQPFNRWMLVVCARQSQALVPVKGMIWYAHGSTEPISILALPPGATSLPASRDYNPAYNVRFKSLYAARVEGDKRERALAMLQSALQAGGGADKKTDVDHIFQLDAVSSIYEMRYNIFFYVSGTRPFAAMVCIDACQRTLLLDIVALDPAAKD